MNITGNTIFIPGATSGIGLALAVRLQAAGNTVVIGGRRRTLLDELAAQHGFATVTIDTTSPASVLAAKVSVLAQHSNLNVLIVMAGVMAAEDVQGGAFLPVAERIIETNVNGPLRVVAAFVEHLQLQPAATLITVSSGLAHTPLAVTPTYNGSKAFIHQFTESIRLQLANTSVEVVELVPPAVQTELQPGGSHNPRALPLNAFADEVMDLLHQQPTPKEILVDAVKFLRFAEAEGRYSAAVEAVNATV